MPGPFRDPLRRRWPVADLVAATGVTVDRLAVAAGYTSRSGHRWAAQGWVDDVIADHLACAAGWPAALVWRGWCSAAAA